MLIVIAGVTGNLGHHLCRSALRRGHQVRGLGRSPDKLEPALREKLESFVVSSDYQDQAAYEKACDGADAVIASLAAWPILVLDSQLLLLRAAEKAGIKRFHALSWNGDWSGKQLGELGSYDAMIAFANHAFLTSPIAPCYTFVGVFANTFFAVPGAGRLEGDQAMWVRNGDPAENKRRVNYVGSPDKAIPFTTEEDAADFTVALITSEYAEKGGFFRFQSDAFSPNQLKEIFEVARPGGQVELHQVMELGAMRDLMVQTKAAARAAGPAAYQAQLWQIIGLEYAYYIPSGGLDFEPVDAAKFPDVRRTTVGEYIQENDYV